MSKNDKTVSVEEFLAELDRRKKMNKVIYFLRYRLTNKSYWSRIWYEQVSSRIRPRNKWVNKVVPRTFSDKDFIYEEVIFAGLVDFWENDNGESCLRYQWEGDHDSDEERRAVYKRVYDELLEAYVWAIARKGQWEGAHTDWKREQEVIEEDTKHLSVIVRNRKWMWT